MKKRGQAALEFLMTYGWAIFAAIIIIGFLYFLVGDPKNLLGDSYILSSPLSQGGFILTTSDKASDTVTIEVRNGAGKTIIVQSIEITNCGILTLSPQTPPAGGLSNTLSNGELKTFIVSCTNKTYSPWDRLNGDINIKHTSLGSSLLQTTSGQISAKWPSVTQEFFFEAESGTLSGCTNFGTYIDCGTSGTATYPFTVTSPGNYIIKAAVNAPNGNDNSVFIDISNSGSPTYGNNNYWDIFVLTSGFKERTASWLGTTFGVTNQQSDYNPKVFTLSSGSNTLYIRGREDGTQIDNITIVKL
ncbi:MAG: hypothetical protein QXI33_01220 [Candidatus Pacearchaeota archaeon]